MSNYWNKLSPLHGTVTKRQSHATGGRVGLKDGKSVKDEVKRRMREETPTTGYGLGLSPITHLRRYLHKKKIKKKSGYTPFYSEELLKSVYPDRDKGWGGKHSRKIEHNAKGGRVGLKQGGKPVKTLVAGFVGKAKDWPGAKAVKKLNKKGRTRK